MPVKFEDTAWEDITYWTQIDAKKIKKINVLIRDILKNPYSGLGKPEPLKHHLGGFWSRRIDDEHRLIYEMDGDTVIISQCRYHYKRS